MADSEWMTTQEAALALGVNRTEAEMVLGWAEKIPGHKGFPIKPTLYLREDVETEIERRSRRGPPQSFAFSPDPAERSAFGRKGAMTRWHGPTP